MTKRKELPTPTWIGAGAKKATGSTSAPEQIAQAETKVTTEKKKDERRVLTVRLPEELYGRLLALITTRRVKRLEGRTANDAVIEAISNYLDSHGA